MNQNMQGAWMITCVSMDEVPVEHRSQNIFTNEKDAVKDANTELSFRGRLAHSCELEFQKSVKDVGVSLLPFPSFFLTHCCFSPFFLVLFFFLFLFRCFRKVCMK
jgi:hypothetical protein